MTEETGQMILLQLSHVAQALNHLSKQLSKADAIKKLQIAREEELRKTEASILKNKHKIRVAT